MKRLLMLLALVALARCIDFEEAEREYCATHTQCPDGGSRLDAGP